VIKLKNILAEGFAWERKADGSLPTIADTTAAYEAKMREQAELNMPFNGGTEDVEDEVEHEEEVDESAKPDYIDADGDGDEEESMKKAFKDKEAKNESINELSDEEIDARWNKPIQNWERQSNTAKLGMMRQAANNMSTSNKSAEKAPSDFYREKLAALKAQRKQIEFDMEQEAEPEGGPIADYYGEALMHVDDQIDAIMKKMHKNESAFVTKNGLQEMRELPLEDRILRNLKGNDYILRETFKK
jgi:hypothetical protein